MNAPRLEQPAKPKATTGIVHLGLGAFSRAFVCPFVADAMAASPGPWGIVGVSLRSLDTRDALIGQGWAYTSVSLAPEGADLRVIDVLNAVLVAPENPDAVLQAICDPAVKIVSLTVTEKGYCHHPATGALNLSHPDVIHDLANDLPKSAIGYLVRGLQCRKAAGTRPFTILSCDNLEANGRLVEKLVLEFALLVDPELAAWIAREARFPCTMVDRITPATTQDDIARVQALGGYHDMAPVMHEPFAQWVIEDRFVDNMHPDFEGAGAQMVADVTPFEDMKLRMLNGTHSALAYSGYLAGHRTISDVVGDPVFAQFARALWTEIIPTVQAPDSVDLSAYADTLLDRYSNPEICHLTWQIAMDGSQKLPQRLLGTLRDRLDGGDTSPMLNLAVAAWMRYVGAVDEAGEAIDVRDPLAETLRDLTAGPKTPAERVEALLGVRDVFPHDLADRLRPSITQAYDQMVRSGARGAIMTALGSR